VNHTGAIERQGINDPALHEINDQRAQPDFDRMGAHAQQNGSVLAVTLGNLAGDRSEILGGENVR